jgi:hypothetical protein
LLWWAFWSKKNNPQGTWNWSLLAFYFSGCISLLQIMWKCQRISNITHKNQIPLTNILISEIFYVWGIYFMGPFSSYFGNLYILFAVIMCPNGLRWKPHELMMLMLI